MEEYPKLKVIKRDKWKILIEIYPNQVIGYLKYNLGNNYIKYQSNYWDTEKFTEDEIVTQTAGEAYLNRINYLEKLIDELLEELEEQYLYENKVPFD